MLIFYESNTEFENTDVTFLFVILHLSLMRINNLRAIIIF